MRDLHSNIGIVNVLTPAVLSADTASAAIDLAGFNSAEFALTIGAGGITFDATNKVEFKLTESDASGGIFTAVDAADVLGVTVAAGGIVKSLVAAHAAVEVLRFGYRGYKRFLKLTADFSGTHGTGTAISCVLVKGTPAVAPVA